MASTDATEPSALDPSAAPCISLCMIVRDEAAMLPGCLASVSGAVDEIVIWGKVECLLGVGEPMEALSVVKQTLDERPDGWVLTALATEALGMLEPMMSMVAKAQASLPAGFVAPHRRERYADALALASMYSGQPAAVPGPLGQVAKVMAGDFGATDGVRDADPGALRRVIGHVLEHGSAAHVANLRDPRGRVACPELKEILG